MQSFLKEFAQRIYKDWAPNLHKIAIVFNNKRPVQILQYHLSELIDKPIFGPQTFTIDEWIEDIDEAQRIDEIEEFFILYEIYNELLGEHTISQDAFFGLFQMIRQDFHQIQDYLVSAELLFTYLKDIAEIEILFPSLSPEQKEFLRSFWSGIEEEKNIPAQRKFVVLWQRLNILFKEYEKRLKTTNKTTLAYSYKKISKNPENYKEKWSHYEHIYFVGFNAMHSSLQKIIAYIQQENKFTFFHDWDSYYANNKIDKAGFFYRQQKNLIDENAQPLANNFIKEKKFHIYGMQGNVAQAKFLNKLIPKLIPDKNPKMEEIAIILVDENMAIPVLQSMPEKYPYNLSMGYPFIYSEVYQWIIFFLEVQKYYHQNNSKQLPKDLLEKQFPLIHKEYPMYIEEWKAMLNRYSSHLYIKSDIFENYKIPLLNKKVNSREFLTEIRLFLENKLANIEEGNEYEEIESNLLLYSFRTFDSFYKNVITYQDHLDLSVLIQVIQRHLKQLNIPLAGIDLNAIQVLGLLESRALDFKKIIIMNANEGIFPSSSQRPSFIPDNIRRAFKMPVLEHQDALVAHVFYSLVQRAEEVHVLYNATISNDSTGELSRFLQQVEYESKHEFKYYYQNQLIEIKKNEPLQIEKTEEVKNTLYQRYSKSAFSASSLNAYMSCSLRFYLERVLKFEDTDIDTSPLSPITLGLVIHKVLENAYQEYLNKQANSNDVEEIIKNAPKIHEEVFATHENLKHIQKGTDLIILENIASHGIKSILEFDKKHVPFKVIGLEEKILLRSEELGFTIQNADASVQIPISFYAEIDRIDFYKGAIRLIDYKTGNVEKLEFKSMEEVFKRNVNREGSKENIAFQLLLYAWIYYKKNKPEKIIVPQVWSSRVLYNADEGIYLKVKNVELSPDLDFTSFIVLMEDFELELISLLEEIFFNDLPFKHPIENKKNYCENTAFSIFCFGGDSTMESS
ncbi:MAG TPA: PD-(D/E)XK nuclease family protein [Chitinophagaceae bacterium]|nr:PD-(D/E)XK nuclease family protein [Chitinophagaceae bacterium]